MTTSKVETITSPVDYFKLILAVCFVSAGLLSYYLLPISYGSVRALGVVFGLIVGAGLSMWSEPGRRFLAFARDSYKELRRVTWSTPKEAIQMTLIVFLFVAVMALYMFLVDGALGLILHFLGLGYK